MSSVPAASLPATMKAIVLDEPGDAGRLQLREVPAPRPFPGWVVIRVHAAGVCYRDVIDRRGGFPGLKRPVVLGHELAGEVVELGPGVTELAVGDRVVNLHRPACGACAMCRAGQTPRCLTVPILFGQNIDGAYAERIAVPVGALVRLPASISWEHGAFLNCTAGVALRALRERGRLTAGETVLVTGASGGVGLHALQVARAMGARPVAVTSSQAKAPLLAAHGADEVIVSPDLAFHHELRRKIPAGVDVALDCVGTPTLNASLRSLSPMGRCVVAGNVTTTRAEVNLGYMILKEGAILGSSGCSREDLEQVLRWTEEGLVRPVLAETLPLAQAAEAHRRLEARDVIGRMVLKP